MATTIVRAIDQDALHAHLAHVAEGDLFRPHAAIKAARNSASNYRFLAARNARELRPVVGVDRSQGRPLPVQYNAMSQPMNVEKARSNNVRPILRATLVRSFVRRDR
jgi:hypothetical protein